jgi:hypothetical protein
VAIPNENIPTVIHGRPFDAAASTFSERGVRADSDAGGEVRRDAYARPDLYRRVTPPPAHA